MTKTEQMRARHVQQDRTVAAWAAEHGFQRGSLDIGQQWMVFAALQMVEMLKDVPALRRVLGFLLMHSSMGLGSSLVGAILGVTDRAVRDMGALDPKELLESIRHPARGHAQPKLRPEDAGRVAKILVEHPGAEVAPLLDCIKTELGVSIDRLTFRRYVVHYGLGVLRDNHVDEGPLFWAEPTGVAHSS